MSAKITEKCSLYKPYYHRAHGVWITGTRPETVNIMEMLTTSFQPELLAQIKNEPDKDKRGVLKLGLWGITASSVQSGGRGEDYVTERNGLMAFDIDKYVHKEVIEGKEVTTLKPIEKHQVPEILAWVKQIPFTLYCGKSASDLGVWGLFRVSDPDKHDQHFDAMQIAFNNVGLEIDPAPRNIASLRFLAFDPDGYFNEAAEIFTSIKLPEVKAPASLISQRRVIDGDKSNGEHLIAKFNAECTTQDMYTILENFGFQYHSTKGNKIRFTRPGKSTKAGLSVDFDSTRRTLYSFSSEVPLLEKWKPEKAGGWSCSPITALLLYGFGGTDKKHWAQAFNYLKNK